MDFNTDWDKAHLSLHEKGFVVLDRIIDENTCNEIISIYNQPKHFRKPFKWSDIVLGWGSINI